MRIEFYSGSTVEEEPRVLWIEGRRVEVTEVLERALAPNHRLFRVRGDDGRVYTLREESGAWTVV